MKNILEKKNDSIKNRNSQIVVAPNVPAIEYWKCVLKRGTYHMHMAFIVICVLINSYSLCLSRSTCVC